MNLFGEMAGSQSRTPCIPSNSYRCANKTFTSMAPTYRSVGHGRSSPDIYRRKEKRITTEKKNQFTEQDVRNCNQPANNTRCQKMPSTDTEQNYCETITNCRRLSASGFTFSFLALRPPHKEEIDSFRARIIEFAARIRGPRTRKTKTNCISSLASRWNHRCVFAAAFRRAEAPISLRNRGDRRSSHSEQWPPPKAEMDWQGNHQSCPTPIRMKLLI